MTAILGVSAFYHDSAAALVRDGEIVAAAQEERFTRKKHDAAFPAQAARYCLQRAGLTPDELDYVAFYDKPLLKFERLLETYLSYAPRGFSSFRRAIPQWLDQKLHLRRELRRGLGGDYRRQFVFAEHHESHAASAFYPSPFEEAAVLTIDGVGEWATASYGVGSGHRLDLLGTQRFPHSLGLLYSAFTYYCGFRVNSGEYKLMGLAPYGTPRFADRIREKLLHLNEDGTFALDMRYFNYCQGLTMTSSAFDRLFGGPPRQPETPIEQRHMDLAASVQGVTEEIVLRMAHHVHEVTGQSALCLAGGVALNCVANGRLQREGPFEKLWIQPAAGDAGGALGVALFVWHHLLEEPRRAQSPDGQRGSLLGPEPTDDAIQRELDGAEAVYEKLAPEETCRRAAELLADGQVVGWVQGPMEFGPRALGARSILGDPRRHDMQSTMNLKIKFRESFRPFAPCVLEERATEYFELGDGVASPYMLIVAPVAEGQRTGSTDPQAEGLEQLGEERSRIPAVTHVDYSARVQTVDEERNPRFARLLHAFDELTGCPVLINTSFNVRGEPIVQTPADALRCFLLTDMDALVVGDFLLEKSSQPAELTADRELYLSQFDLD
ncbi:MAG: carbamoyltransferase [Acidobacteriota bacterium]